MDMNAPGVPGLKSHYRSGKDDLAADFFRPCLRLATLYRRAVGYFSTSALLSWTDALSRVAMDGGLVVHMVASPELSSHTVLSEKQNGQTERGK